MKQAGHGMFVDMRDHVIRSQTGLLCWTFHSHDDVLRCVVIGVAMKDFYGTESEAKTAWTPMNDDRWPRIRIDARVLLTSYPKGRVTFQRRDSHFMAVNGSVTAFILEEHGSIKPDQKSLSDKPDC